MGRDTVTGRPPRADSLPLEPKLGVILRHLVIASPYELQQAEPVTEGNASSMISQRLIVSTDMHKSVDVSPTAAGARARSHLRF